MRPILVLLLVLGLAACGERSQEPQTGQRSYQGKRDTLPWDNGPLTAEYRGAQWKQGDRASWEHSIKQRQLAQHEHKRIYQ